MLSKSWPQNLKTNKVIGKYVTKFLPCKNAPIGKEYQAQLSKRVQLAIKPYL